jgi:hypothetical protein
MSCDVTFDGLLLLLYDDLRVDATRVSFVSEISKSLKPMKAECTPTGVQ